ncbi:hypothetical protein RF11_01239 [Thelohanellus kitauei]|uniref:Uncharacterized protein n=1 Tax=Thelohanellus kitauei TaxID=669202 RepID=A0A0C2MRS0_THEKT|nr:hypothetical protein RF11_01239 [Thelohanellus kitauei]
MILLVILLTVQQVQNQFMLPPFFPFFRNSQIASDEPEVIIKVSGVVDGKKFEDTIKGADEVEKDIDFPPLKDTVPIKKEKENPRPHRLSHEMERQELRSKMLELKNEMEDLQDDVSNLEFETSVLMAFLGLFIFSLVGFSVLIAWSRRRRHCTQQGEMVKLISV